MGRVRPSEIQSFRSLPITGGWCSPRKSTSPRPSSTTPGATFFAYWICAAAGSPSSRRGSLPSKAIPRGRLRAK